FVFVVSAVLAGVAGALYAPQVGIITPAKIGVLPSIEMVVWVAAGGRGTLVGAVAGAFGVNWMQSWLTTSYPDVWLLFLGGLFMGVVLFFPDGVVGAVARAAARVWSLTGRARADRGHAEHGGARGQGVAAGRRSVARREAVARDRHGDGAGSGAAAGGRAGGGHDRRGDGADRRAAGIDRRRPLGARHRAR